MFKRITSLFHSDRVQLLPEPDAAALWGTRDEPAVLYGRDMLVDNGGGTTDIVCYQKGKTEIERCQKHLVVRQSDVAGACTFTKLSILGKRRWPCLTKLLASDCIPQVTRAPSTGHPSPGSCIKTPLPCGIFCDGPGWTVWRKIRRSR